MVDAIPRIASKTENNKRDSVLASEPQYLVTNQQSTAELLEFLTDLSFEALGGQELINISRHDLVSGQSVVYSPIKNLSGVRSQYNPGNIVALQGSSDETFKSFTIRLEDYLADPGLGPSGESIYIGPDGSLIINFINVEDNQQIEIQLLKNGAVLNDTIYKDEL